MNREESISLEIPCTKRRAWAEINLNYAEYNYRNVRNNTNSKVCCVIKANAYGHGAVQLAHLYQSLGADYLAVSNIEEALQLRRSNIHLPVLVLGYTSCDCAKILADNKITQCVYSYEYGVNLAQSAKQSHRTVRVHIKIDTGMGRIGFLCRDGSADEIEDAVEVCKLPGLDVEGVFTHFAVADENFAGEVYTRKQFDDFKIAISKFEKRGVEFRIKHCANSATIFDYPEFHFDMVRAGVVLYGLKPSEQVRQLPDLKPVMSLHSVVSHIKTVRKGQAVSYGRTYVADSDRRIATIPIGYADGFRRLNGQQRYCISINGLLAPIVGRVCMDQLMVDVTRVPCKVGDEVVVFGDKSSSSVEEIARLNDTINYEIVCDVGERIPRVFIKKGKIVGWKDRLINE